MSIARLDLRNSGDTAGPRGLSVNVAGSGIQSVMLSADAQIYGVEKRRLGDIG